MSSPENTRIKRTAFSYYWKIGNFFAILLIILVVCGIFFVTLGSHYISPFIDNPQTLAHPLSRWAWDIYPTFKFWSFFAIDMIYPVLILLMQIFLFSAIKISRIVDSKREIPLVNSTFWNAFLLPRSKWILGIFFFSLGLKWLENICFILAKLEKISWHDWNDWIYKLCLIQQIFWVLSFGIILYFWLRCLIVDIWNIDRKKRQMLSIFCGMTICLALS